MQTICVCIFKYANGLNVILELEAGWDGYDFGVFLIYILEKGRKKGKQEGIKGLV
jgi:hypothetical protein